MMTPFTLSLWSALLIAQNFTSAVNSRAKNQNDLWYTAVTALMTNMTWIMSNLFTVDNVVKAMRSGSAEEICIVVGVYTSCTVVGTLSSQWLAMKYVEPWLDRRKK